MKESNKLIIAALGIYALQAFLFVVMVGLFIFLVSQCAKEVEESGGLKPQLERIWEDADESDQPNP